MAFDGIVTRAVAQELSAVLASGRIDKVYQPQRDELIFLIRTGKEKRKLHASCNNDHPGIYGFSAYRYQDLLPAAYGLSATATGTVAWGSHALRNQETLFYSDRKSVV